MPQTILVTGASSGIGRRTAALLARNGYRVFGTSRRPQTDTLDGVEMLPLDVTDADSVRACVEAVMQKAGQIDVLVNNAGVELFGALEEISVEEAQQLFDTNLWGVVRMSQAVLPNMRKRRDGLIINMSSAGGFAGTPMQGVYVASKHALEGYTETLMYEVERFGVRVAMVEPGYFHSEIAAKRILPANQIRAYNRMRNRVINDLEHKFKHAPEPHAVAEKVLDIVEGRSRTLRNPVTGYGLLGARYAKALPEWLVFAYGRRYTGARPLRQDIPLLAVLIAPIVGVLILVGLVRRLGKDDRGN